MLPLTSPKPKKYYEYWNGFSYSLELLPIMILSLSLALITSELFFEFI